MKNNLPHNLIRSSTTPPNPNSLSEALKHSRPDAEIEAMGAPFRHAARVKVSTRDGRSFEKLILHRRGSPEAPLKPQDIEYKFRHVVRSCIPEARMLRIVDLVRQLEQLENTRELLELVAAPTV